jgi:hypothetical protein
VGGWGTPPGQLLGPPTRVPQSNFVNKAPKEIIETAQKALNESKIQGEILLHQLNSQDN